MKTIQRIAGVFLLISLIVGGIILVRTGGDFSQLSNEQWVQKEKTFEASQITQLRFDTSSTDVTVIGNTDTDQVLIKYPESQNRSYTIIEKDGQLTISEKYERIFGFISLDIDFFFGHKRVIEVMIPKDILTKLTVEGSSSDVAIQNLIVKEDIQVELSSGSITIEDSQIGGSFLAELTSGDVTVAKVKSSDFSLLATSGSIQLEGVEVTNLTEIGATSGDILLGNFTPGKVTELSVTSGDVYGNLAGTITDYTIQSHTTSGTNNLPQDLRGGNKQLQVEVTSGDISLQFDQ